MRLVFKYSGDNQGFFFPPVNLLMLANEFRKYGVKVDLVQDTEDYDYYGIPSDNIFNNEYKKAVELLKLVSGGKVDFTKMEVDMDEIDFDIPAVITSLGCVYKCKYCPHRDINFIPRDFDIVIKELQKACEYSYFEFLDNNVMANKERFFSIVEHIPEVVTWGALMNIEDYSHKDLQYLYDKGLRNIYLGLETFNEADLDYFGKTYHKRVNSKEFLYFLKHMGFNVLVFLIRGLPNETESSWNEMIEWLKRNDIYYTIGHFHHNGDRVPHPIYGDSSNYDRVMTMDTYISRANFINFIQNTLS